MPKNAFGVFVTVKRNNKVHGCQGYWDPKFAKLEPSNLYDHLLQVAHAAMWLDDRRFNFAPIETETKIIIEIDYMYLPIKKINNWGDLESLLPSVLLEYPNNMHQVVCGWIKYKRDFSIEIMKDIYEQR